MSAFAIQFDSERHEYRNSDGKLIPSVTQVIGAAGLIDRTWYTPEARDRGTAVHAAVSLDLANELDESSIDPQVAPYLAGYRDFGKRSGVVVFASELAVYHPTCRYAGMLDLFCAFDMGLAVMDIKTGMPEPWHGIQTCAYASAMTEMLHAGVIAFKGVRHDSMIRRFGLYLTHTGDYRLREHTDHLSDQRRWAAALELYHYRQAEGLL